MPNLIYDCLALLVCLVQCDLGIANPWGHGGNGGLPKYYGAGADGSRDFTLFYDDWFSTGYFDLPFEDYESIPLAR